MHRLPGIDRGMCDICPRTDLTHFVKWPEHVSGVKKSQFRGSKSTQTFQDVHDLGVSASHRLGNFGM
jgi:hypothetical protein